MIENYIENSLSELILLLLSVLGFILLYPKIFYGIRKRQFTSIILAYILASMLIPKFSYAGFGILLMLSVRAKQLFSGRPKYESAVAKVEGGGIKRGLTPPEAAAVLSKSFPQIISLVLLQLLRKLVIRIYSDAPVSLSVVRRYAIDSKFSNAKDRVTQRYLAAQSQSVVLYPYEHVFIEYIDQNSELPLNQLDFDVLLKPFLLHVSSRIAGYNLPETRKYFQAIIQRAPIEARTEGRFVSEKSKIVEKNVLWILLHQDVEQLFSEDFENYSPAWARVDGKAQVDGNFSDFYQHLLSNIVSDISVEEIERELLSNRENLSAKIHDDISHATFNG